MEIAHQKIIRDDIKSSTILPKKTSQINNLEIKDIPKEKAMEIILKYEWLGTIGKPRHCYGAFDNNDFIGCVCYGVLNAPQGYKNFVGKKYSQKGKGIQLIRGACVYWAHPHTASKLISESLKLINKLNYKYVVAFSDPEAGEIGTVYQATNWHYTGETIPSLNLYFGNKKILSSQDIYRYIKPNGRGLNEILSSGDIEKHINHNSPKVGRLKVNELIKGKDKLILKKHLPKHRYVYLCGTKKEKKEMMSILKNKIKPYPKREQ